MAMIDYGAIAFKNGKLISTEKFTPMIDMVGWEDTENDLKGNYFAYVGDKDCTLAFYKEQMVIVERYYDGSFSRHYEFFNNTYNYKWYKWVKHAGICDEKFPKVKVTKRNGYLVCKWKYKGDKYKVYFGCGVDLNYYKKCHMVNYYRSPKYIIKHKICRWFKDKINNLKKF